MPAALPPGPRVPSAVIGVQFLRAPLDMLLKWHARYGDVFRVRFPGFGSGCYVADPDAIKLLFTGDQSDLLAGDANSFLTPVLGQKSVLVLDGPEHLRHRKLMLPPFQGSRVGEFREVVRDVAEAELASWHPGRRLVLRERMRAVTFEVICRAVFGVTEPARVQRLRLALAAIIDVSPMYFVVGALRADAGRWSPGGRFKAKLRHADELIYEEIRRRRGEPDLDERTDVLSVLLRARDENGNGLTDIELRDELMTMLSAGHETTATALAHAFELLLRNPAVLDRLRDELSGGDDAYLDATMREVLRVRPVIDATERTLTKPRVVAGWELPAGEKVYPAIALTQLRPDLYPEPHAFRPERFLQEGADSSYTWLPFGGGIRRCIGAALAQAELAEVLRAVIPAVDLRPVRAEPDPIVMRSVTMAPRHGVEVDVVSRHRSPAPAVPVA